MLVTKLWFLKSLETPSTSSIRVGVNKNSLEVVSNMLWKCQRNNGITIPEVTFSSPSAERRNSSHTWQEKRWVTLHSEATPTKAEVPFFCAGEICLLFLAWSQSASKNCPPFMCKSKKWFQGFVFPWALFRIVQSAKYIMALFLFPCNVSASFYRQNRNKTLGMFLETEN